MRRHLKAFGAFWYDFVIGDDWLLPVAAIIGLAATYGLAPAWWPLPTAVAAAMVVSLWRAVRRK